VTAPGSGLTAGLSLVEDGPHPCWAAEHCSLLVPRRAPDESPRFPRAQQVFARVLGEWTVRRIVVRGGEGVDWVLLESNRPGSRR